MNKVYPFCSVIMKSCKWTVIKLFELYLFIFSFDYSKLLWYIMQVKTVVAPPALRKMSSVRSDTEKKILNIKGTFEQSKVKALTHHCRAGGSLPTGMPLSWPFTSSNTTVRADRWWSCWRIISMPLYCDFTAWLRNLGRERWDWGSLPWSFRHLEVVFSLYSTITFNYPPH